MLLHTIPLGKMGANCYVVIDETTGEAAVIDVGWFTDELKGYIDNGEIKNLKYILLTHGHFDHICGVYDLKQFVNAPVAVHYADANCLYDENFSLANDGQYPQKPLQADILLHDGDVLEVGNIKIEVMHTPGHTLGSVCFICENERTIFSGDTLFCRTVGRTDFYGGSSEQMHDSIMRLSRLDGDYNVYPGHNRSTTLSDERVRNIYMRRWCREE